MGTCFRGLILKYSFKMVVKMSSDCAYINRRVRHNKAPWVVVVTLYLYLSLYDDEQLGGGGHVGTLSNAMHGTPSNSTCKAYKAQTQRTLAA